MIKRKEWFIENESYQVEVGEPKGCFGIKNFFEMRETETRYNKNDLIMEVLEFINNMDRNKIISINETKMGNGLHWCTQVVIYYEE
jgi:hypothetical protein